MLDKNLKNGEACAKASKDLAGKKLRGFHSSMDVLESLHGLPLRSTSMVGQFEGQFMYGK